MGFQDIKSFNERGPYLRWASPSGVQAVAIYSYCDYGVNGHLPHLVDRGAFVYDKRSFKYGPITKNKVQRFV
jgi:hypothetical protein